MEDWDSWLSVETEREIEKHHRERESLTTGATGANSGCFILIGLLIGLGFLAAICLLLIIPS